MADDDAPNDFLPERYRGYLYVLARVRLQRGAQAPVDASDVVQDALLRAHRKRAQCRGQSEGERRAWLRRILANALADAFRKKGPSIADLGDDLDGSAVKLENLLLNGDSSPSARLGRDEQLLQLANALVELPESERSAIQLRFLQDPEWSLTEIAAHLGRPTAKAVAGLLARGLKKLRKRLGESSRE